MTWFRVDDGLHSHPKIRKLSYAARGVLMTAGSYAAHYETDGVLDVEFVKSLRRGKGGRSALNELVLAGLLEPCEDGVLRIHDFLQYNPSRAELDAQRQRNRRKQKAHRARGRQAALPWDDCGSETDDVTGLVTPTRDAGLGGEEVQQPNEERSELDALVDQVLAKLNECPRFTINPIDDRMRVENAIELVSEADALAAAREAVIWAGDPAYRNTNAVSVLLSAMRKQVATRERTQPSESNGTDARPGLADRLRARGVHF